MQTHQRRKRRYRRNFDPTSVNVTATNVDDKPVLSKDRVVSEVVRRVTQSGIVYEGEFVGGKLRKGTKTCKDGRVYEGEFFSSGFLSEGTYSKNGRVIFKGTFYPNGKFQKGVLHTKQYTYDGEWNVQGKFIQGKRSATDRRAVITYEIGTWVDGHLVTGTRGYCVGVVEEGEFDGKLVRGKKTRPKLPTLEGRFVDGILVDGTCTMLNGIKLVGRFSDGDIVEGVIILTNNTEFPVDDTTRVKGSKYMYGSWDGDKLVEGILVDITDGRVLEGTFVDTTLKHGKATFLGGSYIDGDYCVGSYCDSDYCKKLINGVIYMPNKYRREGTFDHKNQTKGVFEDFQTGIRYEGDFKKGKLVKGTIDYPGKMRYRGDCKDGFPHGIGCMYGPDNNRNGEWQNGEFMSGTLSLRQEDGSYTTVTYNCGEVAPPSYHAMEDKMRVAIEQVGRMEAKIDQLASMNKMLMLLLAHHGIELPINEPDDAPGLDDE